MKVKNDKFKMKFRLYRQWHCRRVCYFYLSLILLFFICSGFVLDYYLDNPMKINNERFIAGVKRTLTPPQRILLNTISIEGNVFFFEFTKSFLKTSKEQLMNDLDTLVKFKLIKKGTTEDSTVFFGATKNGKEITELLFNQGRNNE